MQETKIIQVQNCNTLLPLHVQCKLMHQLYLHWLN